MSTKQTIVSRDTANRKLVVTREFAAPLAEVWRAWTERDLLDQWWAPHPWKTNTISLDFREGGQWLYSMVGPDAVASYCRADFGEIREEESFTARDAFCDEQGNINPGFPFMYWKNSFSVLGTGTLVTVEITFDREEDMQKIIDMGFEVGFTAAHSNLDALLENRL